MNRIDRRKKDNLTEEYKQRLKTPNFKERRKLYARKWYLKNKDNISSRRKKKYNPIKRKEYIKGHFCNTTKKHLQYTLKTRFKMTLSEYNNLLNKQNNLCAICGNPETISYSNGNITRKRRLAIDHDHKTGKVRGLLCHFCNVGLGHFKENQNLLLKAIKYIKSN